MRSAPRWKDAADNVKMLGGTVVGQSRHPLNASDFASFLLQAQASKAQVVALANGGRTPSTRSRRRASSASCSAARNSRPCSCSSRTMHALGLDTAQGPDVHRRLLLGLRRRLAPWSARFQQKYKNLKPTMVQAGVYSSVLHYLRSVAAAGSVDAR